MSLMVDPIRRSLTIDDTSIGLLLGPAFACFFVLGSLPTGWAVDRYSKRLVIFLGVSAWSVATIGCGLATTFGALLVARCLVGVGEATLQPAGWGILSRLVPPHRLALAMSIFAAGSQIGASFASLGAGHLIGRAQSIGAVSLPIVGMVEPWQLIFICCGLPGPLLALLIFTAPSERTAPSTASSTSRVDLFAFLRHNWVFLTCHILGFSFLAAAAYGLSAWAPTYLMRVGGMEVSGAGTVMGLSLGAFGTTGMIFSGWLVDRLHRAGSRAIHLTYFAIASAAIAVAAPIGFLHGAPLSLTVGTICAIYLLQPFTGVAAAALQLATPGPLRGRVSALYVMAYSLIGMSVGPGLVPILSERMLPADHLGLAITIMLTGCACLASVLLFVGRRYCPASDELAGLHVSRFPEGGAMMAGKVGAR